MTFFCSFISWHHFLSCTDIWWHQDETNLTNELTEFSIHNLIYFCLNGKFFKNYLSRHVSLTFVYCFCWLGSSISWNRVEKIVLKTKHLDADMVSQIYSLVIHRHFRVRLDHCILPTCLKKIFTANFVTNFEFPAYTSSIDSWQSNQNKMPTLTVHSSFCKKYDK